MLKSLSEPVYVVRPILPDVEKVHAKINEIWDAQWLTNGGKQLQGLEAALEQKLSVDHVSLFANGTLALEIAIQAMKLEGEVITTPFTFPATTHAIQMKGLTPVFCDVEPTTFNIDVTKIEDLITEKTSAIIPVHVFGNPCNVEEIQRIALKHDLKVIYDAAHAFDVVIHGKPIANYGDVSMFSFHATKIFHTIEGGALAFNDNSHLYEKLGYLKNFGLIDSTNVEHVGTNAKMNEVSAAVGLLMLEMLDEMEQQRKLLTNTYRDILRNVQGITVVEDVPGVKHNYYSMPILVNTEEYGMSRDELFEKLQEYNVFARRYFYPVTSSYPMYRDLPSSKHVPVAERISDEILCIPLYSSLAVETAQQIADIISELQSAK